MVSGLARLIWSKDILDSEKIAIFVLRLTPELVVDYTSNNKVHVLQRLKEYTLLNHSSISPDVPFRLFSLRRALESMPPDGLKVRLHHDVIFENARTIDEDTINENRMFVENARTLRRTTR